MSVHYNITMTTTLKSTISFPQLGAELLTEQSTADLLLVVSGQPADKPVRVHAAVFSLLSGELAHALRDAEVDVIIFPEGSSEEIWRLVNHLYKGEQTNISFSLAQE